MPPQSDWDHGSLGWLIEPADKRRFCKVCAARRKAKPCSKDSINYDEMLSELGLGQRKAMLVFAQTCEEVINMSAKDAREMASLTEADMERMSRDWDEHWPS